MSKWQRVFGWIIQCHEETDRKYKYWLQVLLCFLVWSMHLSSYCSSYSADEQATTVAISREIPAPDHDAKIQDLPNFSTGVTKSRNPLVVATELFMPFTITDRLCMTPDIVLSLTLVNISSRHSVTDSLQVSRPSSMNQAFNHCSHRLWS